ncbi:hypothetical protein ABID22_002091 [Pontibacter aydingkolensis]|uniref:Uncharacterized protein n=1 Tax=Pontibacter aydingkolensis TaxID=1911536 RepID=A0ABS7CV73_9BACT|nr:hypothetical protein [Pontibacter aydingkolensis]MBW7467707.1 hypothetical protein [Pontibacter aydingkolensis]
MMLLHAILPLLFAFILADTSQLKLQQDIQKDVAKLQQSNSYFISDNTSETASLQSIFNDLQLFGMVSNLDLSKAKYSQHQQGPHQIQQWIFDQGQIKSITQLESIIALDTVVTQHYLENRPPSQHRITNNFVFRAYQVSTATEPAKLFYLTESEQGLLAYHLEEKQAHISYTSSKNGLNHLLPKYHAEVEAILKQSIK